jgi:hypothetical protein
LQPETGLDLHCVADLAVQFARFSAMAAGEFESRVCTAAPALQPY